VQRLLALLTCVLTAVLVFPGTGVVQSSENASAGEHDVAAENPEVVAKLMGLIEKARDDLGDYNRLGKGARQFAPVPSTTNRPRQESSTMKRRLHRQPWNSSLFVIP